MIGMKNLMMKCYIDANVLVSYQLSKSPFHSASKNILKKLYRDRVETYTSPLALDEYTHAIKRVLLHKKLQPIDRILQQTLHNITALRNVKLINPPPNMDAQKLILDYMKNYSLKPRDAYHLLTMKHHTISHFATFDTDFKKVFEDGLVQQFE